MDRVPLYNKFIMQHYHHSPHRKKVNSPTITSSSSIISCGDSLRVELVIRDNKIVDYGFEGNGCILSQAGASIVADLILNKSLQEIRNVTVEDILSRCNAGSIGHSRIACVNLGLAAIQQGLQHYAQSSSHR